MNPQPIDGLITEQQVALRALKAECRNKMLLTAGIVLGVTVLAAGFLSLSEVFSFWEAAALTGLLALLTLTALLNRIEAQYRAEARQNPNLLPPDLDDETLAYWKAADQRYTDARKQMKAERNLILLVGFVLNYVIYIALFAAIVIAAIRWQMRSKALGQKPISPFCRADAALRENKSRLLWASFALWFVVCCWMLFCAMFKYTANSKANAFNNNAKSIYHAASAYQEDLEKEGKDWRLKTTIVGQGEIGAEGSLSAGIHLYFTDAERLWYAVVCDSDGNITAVYCSRSELTESDLHPQSLDEQRALYSKPFHSDEVIGYYAPPPKPANDSIPSTPTTEVITYGQTF